MNPDLRAKLQNNLSSYKDITAKLSTPEIYSDRTKMKSLNQELTKLEASVKLYQKYLDYSNLTSLFDCFVIPHSLKNVESSKYVSFS